MNWRHVMIAAALLPAAGAVAAEDKPLAKLQEAIRLEEAKQPQACIKAARDLIGTSGFSQLNGEFRSYTYYVASICSFNTGDRVDARNFAIQGTEMDGASGEVWRLRAALEMQNEADPVAAVVGLEAMAKRAPEALNAIDLQGVNLYYTRLKQGDAALRRRVLEVFAADSFQPTAVGITNAGYRSELAIIHAGEGDRAGAAALIAGINEPTILLTLSLDPRTRTLIPADLDLRATMERELAVRRDVAASHPTSLAAVVDVADALRWLGRYEEALAGLAAASPEGPAGVSFTDRDDRQNWWWDAVGYANAYLGRYDAALAAFRHGIDAKEGGGTINVSQSINLANQQVIFGRNADALKTLEPLGEGKSASPYGVMQMIGVRGCARFRTGDKVGADADYAYAKAHDADASNTLTELALCRGDLDTAAATLVRRLDNPDNRVGALLVVSDFAPLPASYPKQVEKERLELIKSQPEVKAAIARAGGARRFNLQHAPF